VVGRVWCKTYECNSYVQTDRIEREWEGLDSRGDRAYLRRFVCKAASYQIEPTFNKTRW